ncbi:hypothetical protein PR048_006031 [Dryococelus australis]|uniref:Uncharacterized protein n=1 Tax=Dryococelus australis TaxID=614101 RepID=A0ABQ9I9U6_9NEOP|nr:hypothetical protein PR048_006031 [Dryococelus australis]
MDSIVIWDRQGFWRQYMPVSLIIYPQVRNSRLRNKRRSYGRVGSVAAARCGLGIQRNLPLIRTASQAGRRQASVDSRGRGYQARACDNQILHACDEKNCELALSSIIRSVKRGPVWRGYYVGICEVMLAAHQRKRRACQEKKHYANWLLYSWVRVMGANWQCVGVYLESGGRALQNNAEPRCVRQRQFTPHLAASFLELYLHCLSLRYTSAVPTLYFAHTNCLQVLEKSINFTGTAVVERLDYLPPSRANRVQSPAGSLPRVGIVPDDAAGRLVFSAISRLPRPFNSGAAPYLPRFTLIGCQDLAVRSRTNLFTHSIHFTPPMKIFTTTSIAFMVGDIARKCICQYRCTDENRNDTEPMSVKQGEYGAALECKGGLSGRSLRKPADQRHRPARFPRAKIRERPHRKPSLVRLGGRRNNMTVHVVSACRGARGQLNKCSFQPKVTKNAKFCTEYYVEFRGDNGAPPECKRRGKREIPEKTRQPTASSYTIPTCKNPRVTRPGIEPCAPWWEAISLTALPLWPQQDQICSEAAKRTYCRNMNTTNTSFVVRIVIKVVSAARVGRKSVIYGALQLANCRRNFNSRGEMSADPHKNTQSLSKDTLFLKIPSVGWDTHHDSITKLADYEAAATSSCCRDRRLVLAHMQPLVFTTASRFTSQCQSIAVTSGLQRAWAAHSAFAAAGKQSTAAVGRQQTHTRDCRQSPPGATLFLRNSLASRGLGSLSTIKTEIAMSQSGRATAEVSEATQATQMEVVTETSSANEVRTENCNHKRTALGEDAIPCSCPICIFQLANYF